MTDVPGDAAAGRHGRPVFGRGARARLRVLGLRPHKRLSQSFLEDQSVAAAIVRAAGVGPSTDVLEVGPGLGVMTHRLARQARRVVAVEIDAALAAVLRDDVPGNVCVVHGDILAFEPAGCFDAPYTVVANLPYHITSPALRHLLGAGPPFANRLVVMVQAEVAERITARPGALSALAVSVQVQAQVRLVRHVPAAAFYPRPRVDSAVVLLEPRPKPERWIGRQEVAAFTAVVQAGFKQPRKTLANSLADGLGLARGDVGGRLERAGIDGSLRPQALTVDDWVRLFRSA